MQELALPEMLKKGIAEFNEGRFWQCHETLEMLWHRQAEPERQFTQGIIQIAAGFHHLLKGNHTGACRLFEKGMAKICCFPPGYLGLDMSALIAVIANHVSQAQASARQQPIDLAIAKIKPSSKA